MNEDEISTLGYAPGQPRSMKKRIAIIASVGAAGIAVTVAGISCSTHQGRPVPLAGTPPPQRLIWQTQPRGSVSTTEPADDSATQPSADTSIQHTATAQ